MMLKLMDFTVDLFQMIVTNLKVGLKQTWSSGCSCVLPHLTKLKWYFFGTFPDVSNWLGERIVIISSGSQNNEDELEQSFKESFMDKQIKRKCLKSNIEKQVMLLKPSCCHSEQILTAHPYTLVGQLCKHHC